MAVSKEHVNFYENIKEATMRLQHTVVIYDNLPYHILTIDCHKPDGIFRVYMEPVGDPKGSVLNQTSVPWDGPDGARGVQMDIWMEANKNRGVIRKMMNSPLFNKFRPFDLGMCNSDGHVVYIERMPQRHTTQGLTQQMLLTQPVSLDRVKPAKVGPPTLLSPDVKSCILGDHPSFKECVKNLLDPEIANEGVAFHRNFALLRGPVDTLYLAYKSDVVGVIPNLDASHVKIAKRFAHTREVVEDLRVFEKISII